MILIVAGAKTMGTVVSADCSKVGKAVSAGLRSRTRYPFHHPEPPGAEVADLKPKKLEKMLSEADCALCPSDRGL